MSHGPPGGTSEKSYTAKFLAETEQIRRQLPTASTLLGIDTSTESGWHIVPPMITLRPSAASVAPNMRVTFAGLDQPPEN